MKDQPPEPSSSWDPRSPASRPRRAVQWVADQTSDAMRLLGADNPDIISFEKLYLEESKQLGDEVDKESIRVRTDVAGEPWVAFTPRDRFGLALSGGGIRSATYNLGLMQALAQLSVLKEVDYLSTVSGGGYVGGFWMAWLKRKGSKPGREAFPLGNDQRSGERAEVRHLREFSRFLLPRAGMMNTELWGIVMTVLGGLLPSIVAAIALLFVFWSLWVAITGLVLWAHPVGAILLGVLLALYLVCSEWRWNKSGKSERNLAARTGYYVGSLAGATVITVTALFWPGKVDAVLGAKTEYFAPALLLGAGTLLLLFARVVLSRFFHSRRFVSALEGFERTLTRFLGLTVSLLVLGAMWWAAGKIGVVGGSSWSIPATAGGAVGSAALFAWAKKWLMSPVEETHGSNLFRTAINQLKRATPKLLASLTWILLFLVVGAVMHELKVNPTDPFKDASYRWVVIISLAIIVLTAFLFDPARVGMHEFYRSRISRCYLGASNPNIPKEGSECDWAASNRFVIERQDDDITLKDLRPGEDPTSEDSRRPKPVHLICTAANDVSGDTLGTLYRGARSAVLSGNGISLGNQTARLDDLRLSSALTASAAAFNSQMGRLSMDLGPAVTFLMGALNLRLGLWVPHPTNRYRDRFVFPGRFFIRELLGLSRTDGKHLHLSDGNHFENFGLYELIRRHTRYIIVSDCGADPEVAFDDLANVLRRVREDFGVEIDLDISALRPGENRLAKQHAVVGTVHYNGFTGMDKGTILFFKPTLTGDEPPDVLQYRTRNRAFPHESTGDQFYDEPQWESYRRLGEHAARAVLGFYTQPDNKEANQVDKLFRDARSRWHPTPDRLEQDFLGLSERCASLEADLLGHGPRLLRADVFSEVTELAGTNVSQSPDADEEMAIFSYLLRMMQIMEDVWLSADLDHHWSHPLNEGWMSYFHRWASTPSFRRWWPILSPIYSFGFREFAKDRFGVGVQDKSARPESERSIVAGQLKLGVVRQRRKFMAGRAWQSFQQRHPDFKIPAGKVLFGYELKLLGYDGKAGRKSLPVGFVIVDEQPYDDSQNKMPTDADGVKGWTASWQSNEFFIPRSLQGSGMLARMLDALIKHYERDTSARTFAQMEVRFSPEQVTTEGEKQTSQKPKVVLSQAAREQRIQEIEFYKSRGFHYTAPEKRSGKIILTLSLRGGSRG